MHPARQRPQSRKHQCQLQRRDYFPYRPLRNEGALKSLKKRGLQGHLRGRLQNWRNRKVLQRDAARAGHLSEQQLRGDKERGQKIDHNFSGGDHHHRGSRSVPVLQPAELSHLQTVHLTHDCALIIQNI